MRFPLLILEEHREGIHTNRNIPAYNIRTYIYHVVKNPPTVQPLLLTLHDPMIIPYISLHGRLRDACVTVKGQIKN
jgi:hypothetical protein